MVIGRSAKNKQAPDASGMDSTPGARVRRETSPVREGANINAVIVSPPRKHVNAGGLGTPIPAPPWVPNSTDWAGAKDVHGASRSAGMER